jgi:TolB-like protein
VLPFQNMSGDPDQEYFADGMVEEIITALSRIRWLFVIARNSSFTYKGQAIDVKRVGRELGVRYVLEGSVRKGGGRVRITAQSIEAETRALSRYPSLFVIARNFCFSYTGRAVDVKQVGRELGVRYGLEGACVRQAIASVSLGNSSRRRPASTSGLNAMTAISPTSSRCRTKSQRL